MEKQTAGRKALGDFAPQFAALNDDVLFGEVWAKEDELSPKLRSIATVSALVGKGTAGDALRYHLQTARQHGVTKEEMAALLTHLPSTLAGRTPGQPSLWPRKSTPIQRMQRAAVASSASASQTMPMPSTSRASRT